MYSINESQEIQLVICKKTKKKKCEKRENSGLWLTQKPRIKYLSGFSGDTYQPRLNVRKNMTTNTFFVLHYLLLSILVAFLWALIFFIEYNILFCSRMECWNKRTKLFVCNKKINNRELSSSRWKKKKEKKDLEDKRVNFLNGMLVWIFIYLFILNNFFMFCFVYV